VAIEEGKGSEGLVSMSSRGTESPRLNPRGGKRGWNPFYTTAIHRDERGQRVGESKEV